MVLTYPKKMELTINKKYSKQTISFMVVENEQ